MKFNLNACRSQAVSYCHQAASSCKNVVSYMGKMIQRYPGRAAIVVAAAVTGAFATLTALVLHKKSSKKNDDHAGNPYYIPRGTRPLPNPPKGVEPFRRKRG